MLSDFLISLQIDQVYRLPSDTTWFTIFDK